MRKQAIQPITASFAATTGSTTVVSRNTAGNGTGLPFIQTELPGYAITIAFTSATVRLRDGKLEALTLTVPDIAQDDGRSAQKTCLSIIEENLRQAV